MTAARLQLGSVVWAELEDSNGFRKIRPAVVLSATADIAAGRPVHMVAITTRLASPLPEDYVMLPWHREGKVRSGLRRPCAAVATWQAEIKAGDVQQVVGILPPAVIGELLTKVAATMPPPESDEASGEPTPAKKRAQKRGRDSLVRRK